MDADCAKQVMAVMDLLTSSSSSDDEMNLTALSEKKKRAKIKNFLQVVYQFTEEEFRQNFRLQRQTTYTVIRLYETSRFYPSDLSNGGSMPLSAEHDFLSFLWFAGNKVSLRDVGQRFGVAGSTTFNQINRVMDFLNDVASNVIRLPENKEEAATNFFNVARFPDTIGCIDGTSITIRTPRHKIKSTYVHRHDIPSITLQGICDAKKRFIDTSVGAPAKIHDARVYQLSDISTDLPTICDGKCHVLGDSAYPMREWMLVPFRDYGNLTQQQKLYNKRFCSTRVLIENSFGLLKGRFRQLLEVHMYEVDKICRFVISCCVLHNFCIDFNDEYDIGREMENADNVEVDMYDETEQVLKQLGEAKRNDVMRRVNEDEEERNT